MKSIDIIFNGDKFTPTSLKGTISNIEVLAEYGVLSKRGRYKNKKSPYGLALLNIPLDSIKENLEYLIQNVDALKESNLDRIELDSVFNDSGTYFNYKRSSEITTLLNKLNKLLK